MSDKRIILSHNTGLNVQQQNIDAALSQAHELFKREYQRQCERYRMAVGRDPYYHYEKSVVVDKTYAALSQAVRLLLGY